MNGLLLKKTLRDLKGSLAQTIALVVIVALGVASLLALIGAYRDLGSSYNRTYRELRLADATFAVQSAPESVLQSIQKIQGVASVTGRLIVDTGIDVTPAGGKSEQVRARLIGIPENQQPAVDSVLVTAGHYFGSTPTGTAAKPIVGQALVESHFAKVYGLRPGDRVFPLINGKEAPMAVSGIAASPEYLIVSASRQDIIPSARTFGVLFVPRSSLQTMVNAGRTVNNIAVLFKAGSNQSAVVSSIDSVLQPYGLSTVTLQKDQPSANALRLDLEGYREIGYMMPALILLAAAASLFVMLSRQIRSQQTHIGLMKALGYSRGSVLRHYLTTSLIVSLTGAVVGVAAGYPLGGAITSAYAKELGIPLVQSKFYLDVALSGALITIVVALVAGLFPALRASRMAPAAAMRPDPARALTRGKRTLLERLLPTTVMVRLPLRNVFRVRSRSLSTMVGVVFAFILVLSSWAMLESMQNLVYDTFHKIERWDMAAVFDRPEPMSTVKTVQSWQGVKSVEPLIQLPVTMRALAPNGSSGSSASKQEELLLTAMTPTDSLHRLTLGGTETPTQALAKGKVVISGPTATKLHVAVGDKVSLATPLGRKTLEVSAISNEFMSAVAYVSLAEAESWVPFHAQVLNGFYLTIDPAHAQSIKSQLYHLPGAASVRLKTAVEADWQSLMGLYYAFMGVILIFALVMAFAILFNAMTVNVLEQQREFATMRSLGAGRGRIALLMTTENLLLWVISLIPGFLLGTWAAKGMMSAFASDAFDLTISLSVGTYIITGVGILITMVLAALPAIRRVNRLNLAAATKVLT